MLPKDNLMDGKVHFLIASIGLCNCCDHFHPFNLHVMIISTCLTCNPISGLHPFSHSLKPHGRAWKIHNKKLLSSEVIPTYFSHRIFESFMRQCTGWGYKRLHQTGNDHNAYYNECFLRGLPHLTGMMSRASPNRGRLIPNMEGEPNFYEINKQFPLPPPMMPCQGQFQYPPYHMEGDAGYGASQEPQAGYHTSPNQLSSSPGTYWPPPPVYGHYGDPYAMAAHNPPMGGYSYYPPQYPMQYGHQPYVRNPHYSYPPGFISSNSDTAPPSGAGTVKSGEFPSADAVREEVATTLQCDKPISDSCGDRTSLQKQRTKHNVYKKNM